MAVQLGSAGLNVTDLDRSIEFYSAALGLSEIRRSSDPQRRWAHLGSGAIVLLTLWQQAGEEFSPRSAGLHHVSFEAPTLADLLAAESRLREQGIPLRGDTRAPGELSRSGQLFFLDPDGIRVEIFTDDPTAAGPSPLAQPACGFYEEASAGAP